MIKLEKYTGEKTYMYPSGGLATPDDVKAQYPAITVFAHVIETDEHSEILWAIENLSAMRALYNIDPALSEDEAIAALEEIRNAPQEEPEASAEERIAAALEFNNLLNM